MVFIELLESIVKREKMQSLDVTTIHSLMKLEMFADESFNMSATPEDYKAVPDQYLFMRRWKYQHFLSNFMHGVENGLSNNKDFFLNPDAPEYILGYGAGQIVYEVWINYARSKNEGIKKSYDKLKKELTTVPKLLKQELQNWRPET